MSAKDNSPRRSASIETAEGCEDIPASICDEAIEVVQQEARSADVDHSSKDDFQHETKREAVVSDDAKRELSGSTLAAEKPFIIRSQDKKRQLMGKLTPRVGDMGKQ